MKLKGLPVEEKQSLSTAEISAPTASGKLDLTCWSLWDGEGREQRGWGADVGRLGAHFMLCSTTLLRSPWDSEAPSSVTNFFAWTARASGGRRVSAE